MTKEARPETREENKRFVVDVDKCLQYHPSRPCKPTESDF